MLQEARLVAWPGLKTQNACTSSPAASWRVVNRSDFAIAGFEIWLPRW